MLVGYSVKLLFAVILYVYMYTDNKKRDRAAAAEGAGSDEEEKAAIERGMQDMTEIDNKGCVHLCTVQRKYTTQQLTGPAHYTGLGTLCRPLNQTYAQPFPFHAPIHVSAFVLDWPYGSERFTQIQMQPPSITLDRICQDSEQI